MNAGWWTTSCVAIALMTSATTAAAQGQQDPQAVREHIVIAQDIVDAVLKSVDRIVTTEVAQEIEQAMRAATGTRISAGEWRAFAAAQNRDFQATAEATETKTIKLGAGGALELRTVGGNITVSAGTGADTTVEITRKSRGRTDADAKLGLERVNATVDQRGDRATVSVDYPNENRLPYSVSVSYVVKTPATTRLNASTLGGNIDVADLKGEVTTSTHGGNTNIKNVGGALIARSLGGNMTLSAINSDGILQAETLGGLINLQQVKARRVNASTVGGDVTATDITCDNLDLGTMGGNVSFSGPLAKSGRYELHTNGGDVRFMPAGNIGFELQASTFAGDVRTEGVTLQLQNASTGRGPNRSLRGTVGDGSALVILRTFSGTVVIGKK